METDLSALFEEQRSNQVDWHGPLHSLYELPTNVAEVTVRFRQFTAVPTQGLRLKVRGGSLEVASESGADIFLWTDTAPASVTARVRWKAKSPRSLRIWNTWKVNGVAHAWFGNAGMRISTEPAGSLLLRCSDGVGGPDFDDLVAEVSLT